MVAFVLTNQQFVAVASRRMRAVLLRDDLQLADNALVELQVLDSVTHQPSARMFAIVTYVDRVEGGMCIVSFEPRVTAGSRPAVRLALDD